MVLQCSVNQQLGSIVINNCKNKEGFDPILNGIFFKPGGSGGGLDNPPPGN